MLIFKQSCCLYKYSCGIFGKIQSTFFFPPFILVRIVCTTRQFSYKILPIHYYHILKIVQEYHTKPSSNNTNSIWMTDQLKTIHKQLPFFITQMPTIRPLPVTHPFPSTYIKLQYVSRLIWGSRTSPRGERWTTLHITRSKMWVYWNILQPTLKKIQPPPSSKHHPIMMNRAV